MKKNERFIEVIKNCEFLSFEDALLFYLSNNKESFPPSRIIDMVSRLNQLALHQINGLERIKAIANERACWTQSYLKGEMWSTEEAARANIEPQINNMQVILDACKN